MQFNIETMMNAAEMKGQNMNDDLFEPTLSNIRRLQFMRLVLVASMLAICSPSTSAQSGSTNATNTQIQPLNSFYSPTALACKAACDNNPNCQAWSWERNAQAETEKKKTGAKEGDKEKGHQSREREGKKDKKDEDESDVPHQGTPLGKGGICTLFASVEGQQSSSCVSGVKQGNPGVAPPPGIGGQPTGQPCPPGQVASAQPASSFAPVLVDKLTIRQGPDVKVGNACMFNACVDSTAVLEAGGQYMIEVSGVLLHDETNPSYKGYYDEDAAWAFGGNPALYSAIMPRVIYGFLVDGKGVKDPSGQDVPYNPQHVYRVNYIGQGRRVTFNLSDDEGISEHPLGALTVAIYSVQRGTTGCIPAPTQTSQGSQPTDTNPPYLPPSPTPGGMPTPATPSTMPTPTPTSTAGGLTPAYCPPDPGLLDEQVIQALPDRFTEADTMFLQAGQQYVIEAAGVFGYWDTQKDGVDPVWCYAQWRCGTGQMWQSLQLDGKGMKDISGQDIPYNPGHVYRILYAGQGRALHIAIQGPHGGMHGALRVRVYDATVATNALTSPPCLPSPGGTTTATSPPPPAPPMTGGAPPSPVGMNTPPSNGTSCTSWPAAPGAPGGPVTTATSGTPVTGPPAPEPSPTTTATSGQPPAPPVAANLPPSGASCGSMPAPPGAPSGPTRTATLGPPPMAQPPAVSPAGPGGGLPAAPISPEPSFLPTGPDLVITAVSPAQAAPNSDLQATIIGKNFPSNAVIGFGNLAIQIESLTIVSPTQAKIRFKVPPNASTGATFVYMTTPDGRMGQAPFTVAGTTAASNNPSNPAPPTTQVPASLGPTVATNTQPPVPASLGPANRGNCNPFAPSLVPVEPPAPSPAPVTIPTAPSTNAAPTTRVPPSLGPANRGTSNPPTPSAAPVPTTHVPASLGPASQGNCNPPVAMNNPAPTSQVPGSLAPANPPTPPQPSSQPQPSTPTNQPASNNPLGPSAPAQSTQSEPQPAANPQPQKQPNNWLGPLMQGIGGVLQGMNQASSSPSGAAGMNAADGVNLPGYDYSSFYVQPRWDICQAYCANDQNCKAFTYVKPQHQGENGACYLKTGYSQVARDGCCISGVKNAPNYGSQPQCPPHVDQPQSSQATIGAADGVNLPGYDYVLYPLSQPRWDYCQSLCVQDQRCRAFTYVKPGVQGPQARCWLKSAVPQAVRNACCISGAKSGPTYSGGQPQMPAQPPRQTGCGPRTSQPTYPAQPPRQTGCGPRTSQPAPAPPVPAARTRVRIKVIAGVSCSANDQYTSGFPGVTVNFSGTPVMTGSDGVARLGQNLGEGIPPGTYRVTISANNAKIVYVRLHMTSDSGIGNIISPAGDGSYYLTFANTSNPGSMSEYELAIRFSSPAACN